MSDTWKTLTSFWAEHVKGTNVHMYIHFFPLVHIVELSVPGPNCLTTHVAIDHVLERNPDALRASLLHAITELKNEINKSTNNNA